MEDMKFIIFFIIALITYVIHMTSKKTHIKYDKECKENEKEGVGKIERINQDDSGKTWFYVSFEDNGIKYTAQTSTHNKVPDDLKIGDEVNIKYHFTKGKYALCRIIDRDFECVINYDDDTDIKKVDNYILIASIVFLAFGLLGLINYLLK